jgi:TPR repeat protein
LYNGQGVEKSFSAAASYFKQSADQGNLRGMSNYGVCLENGRGVDQDYVSAAHYYKMSADGGNPLGLWRYAVCLTTGQGVGIGESGSDLYLHKLDEVENGDELNALGNALRYGFDFPLDKVEAVRWYRKAAELGSVSAFVNLGLCYERGEGVSVDLAEAARMYKLAADRGNTDAMMSLGLFHWCDLGGFTANRDEARRYGEMASFELNTPFVCPSNSGDPNDLNGVAFLEAETSGICESNSPI